MNLQPSVSLIIPSYRGEAKLTILFDALAAQTDKDFEAIVVVDGVFDRSEVVVSKENRFNVRLVKFESNKGRVSALNAGLATAEGDILVRCDDDLSPRPDYIAEWKRLVRPGTAVIGQCKNVYPVNRYSKVYGTPRDEMQRHSAYTATKRLWQFWGGNVGMHRDVFKVVGNYDSDYVHYGWEDIDYGYRISKAGFPLSISPTVETLHYAASSNTLERARRAFHSQSARKIFESKHPEALSTPDYSGGAWVNLVSLGARIFRSERKIVFLAKVTDLAVTVLPTKIAEKLISFAVETAGVAGYRTEETVVRTF